VFAMRSAGAVRIHLSVVIGPKAPANCLARSVPRQIVPRDDIGQFGGRFSHQLALADWPSLIPSLGYPIRSLPRRSDSARPQSFVDYGRRKGTPNLLPSRDFIDRRESYAHLASQRIELAATVGWRQDRLRRG